MRQVTLIKSHWLAIVVGLLISVGLLLPHIYFYNSSATNYQGIRIMETDAEVHYAARIQHAVEGHDVGNPFFAEEKNELPPPGFVIAERLLAVPMVLFGVSVNVTLDFYLVVLPFLLTVLWYLLLFRFTGNRLASLAGATLVVAGPELLSLGGVRNLLSWNDVYNSFTVYARPVNPQFSALLFIGYLHLLYTIWEHRKETVSNLIYVLSALLLGLSFYVYFYTWTFFAVISALFSGILLWHGTRANLYKFLFVGVVALAASVPYLLSIIRFSGHEYYADISKTFGLEFSHAPIFSIVGVLTTLLFAGTIWYLRRNEESVDDGWFIGALLLASFLVVNQQIITGTLLQEGHYHWYFNVPIFAFVLVWVVVKIIASYKFVFTTWSFATIATALAIFILVQISSLHYWIDTYTEHQAMAGAIEWLQQNAESEEVVLASNDFSDFLPVYTDLNVYWSRYGFTYLTPQERVIHALFTYQYLYGIEPESMPESAYHAPTNDGAHAYNFQEVSILLGDKKDYLDGFYPDNMAESYEAMYKKGIQTHLSVPYKVDYVVVHEPTGSSWHQNFDSSDVVYADAVYTIYEFSTQKNSDD